MSVINATKLNVQPVGRECKEPKTISVPLDFTTASEFTLTLKPLVDTGAFDDLLSMFIDNRANAAPFNVLMGGTLQTISCPANEQGYFAVLSMQPAELKFTTTGGVLVNVFLANFEIGSQHWKP